MEKRDGKSRTGNKIVCSVKNCSYHKGEFECTADPVSVGPTFANSSCDTVCATFKPKSR